MCIGQFCLICRSFETDVGPMHWSVLLDCTNCFLSACHLSRLQARLSSRMFFLYKMQLILSSDAAESPRVCLVFSTRDG